MVITDPRFAAELVTTRGKVHTFDDIGGLVLWFRDSGLDRSDIAGIWVYDSRTPEALLRADSAVFVRSPALRTPMASGLAAVASGAAADSLVAEAGGTVLDWKQVLALPDLHDRPDHPDIGG
jgi:copper chaperone NosL